MPETGHTLILLAAGSGSRMGGVVADKILAPLCGVPVFIRSLNACLESGIADRVVLVYRDAAQLAQLQACLSAIDFGQVEFTWVQGGSERQESVIHALEAASDSDFVYIHDCARPLVSPEALRALKDTVVRDGAAVLAHPVVDTIKRIPQKDQLQLTELDDLERCRLWAMETPQAFRYPAILQAYRHVRQHQLTITDDTAALATIGQKTSIVPNASPNPKITTPADLNYAAWLLEQTEDSKPKCQKG